MGDRDTALHRLRLLQASCAEFGDDTEGGGFEALLFVCGVDGKDNWGSAAAVRWLVLGESGSSLDEGRVRPFFVGADVPKGLGVPDGEREGVGEALEECVVLVTRRSVAVLYDSRARRALLPLLHCPGLREYAFDFDGDNEVAEEKKTASFVRLVRCEGGQLQTAPISVVSHSFRLIFGRVIISRNGLEA